jgi:hypothetical protein
MTVGRISALDGSQSTDVAYNLNIPGRGGFADGQAVPRKGVDMPAWLMNAAGTTARLHLADGQTLEILIRSTTSRGLNAAPRTDTVSFVANAGFE